MPHLLFRFWVARDRLLTYQIGALVVGRSRGAESWGAAWNISTPQTPYHRPVSLRIHVKLVLCIWYIPQFYRVSSRFIRLLLSTVLFFNMASQTVAGEVTIELANKNGELFDYVYTSRTEEETFHFLGFEFLHRLNIVRIQNDLITMRDDISRTRGQSLEKEKLSKLLNEYSGDSVNSN